MAKSVRLQLPRKKGAEINSSVPVSDSNGSYTVGWGSVSYTSSYTLQQRVNGGSWHTKYSGASRSKAFSGQSNGTYGYRVRACNASGCGPWSGTHNVTAGGVGSGLAS